MALDFDAMFDEDEFEAFASRAMAKAAVVPPGAGAPPMDPGMMGGAPPMDPGMMGGAPPMDPAAAGMAPAPPPLDPAMGMAPAPPPPPAAAPAPKSAKPDVAFELQKLNESVYKIGVGQTILFNSLNLDMPPAIMFGAPPETLDPAIQAAAYQPNAGMPPTDGGGGPPAAAPLGVLFAEVGFPKTAAAASPFAIGKVADEIAAIMEPEDAPEDAHAPPDVVGSPYAKLAAMDSAPVSLATSLRRRVYGV